MTKTHSDHLICKESSVLVEFFVPFELSVEELEKEDVVFTVDEHQIADKMKDIEVRFDEETGQTQVTCVLETTEDLTADETSTSVHVIHIKTPTHEHHHDAAIQTGLFVRSCFE